MPHSNFKKIKMAYLDTLKIIKWHDISHDPIVLPQVHKSLKGKTRLRHYYHRYESGEGKRRSEHAASVQGDLERHVMSSDGG
jgi:hypothetical protein